MPDYLNRWRSEHRADPTLSDPKKQAGFNRRQFLQVASASALVLAAGVEGLGNTPVHTGLQIAYSAITWGGNDGQAINDISATGFRGIQLRASAFGPYRTKPSELKAILDKHGLQLAMFSSGDVEVDPGKFQSTIDKHVAHASFVKALGGSAIQLTNSARPKDRLPTTKELKRLATVMNEIGKQTADLGIQTVYHNHMHQLGETPAEVDVIVQTMNPKAVRLLLDIAHYRQGGGEPEKAIQPYRNILHSLHLKDTKSPLPDQPNDPNAYKFVELGRGNVNVPAVFEALATINFTGWGVVELDGVPEPGRTALQCAQTNKEYITQTLKMKL